MTEKEKIRHNLYGQINRLYSANYSCYRVSMQDKFKKPSTYYSNNQIFKNNSNNDWINKKLTDVSYTRNDIETQLSLAIASESLAYQTINLSLNNLKGYLVNIYNILFEKNKTFDDLFDGFVCKDDVFSKYIELYELGSSHFVADPEIMYLLSTYDNYMDTLEKSMTLESIKEITATISDDITNFNNLAQNNNPKLIALSKSDICDMTKKSNNIMSSIDNKLKSENKKLIMLYKKYRKNGEASEKREIGQKITATKNILFNLNLKKQKCTELLNLLNEFKLRFESANKDINSNPLSLFAEGFVDIVSGVYVPKKPKLNSIYVHRLEKSYYDYLYSLLTDEYSLPYEKRSATSAPEINIFDL